MWTSRLFWKLFIVYVGLNFTLAVAFLFVVDGRQRGQFDQDVDRSLRDVGKIVRAQLLAAGPEANNVALAQILTTLGKTSDIRVSLIARDGAVLADSHGNRDRRTPPEDDILAICGERLDGIAMAYRDAPLREGDPESGYVRTYLDATPLEETLAATRNQLFWLAAAFAVAAMGLTYLMVGYVIEPLSDLTAGAQAIVDGDFEHRVSVHSKDELGALAIAFKKMQHELARRFTSLEEQNDRLTTILSSMVEGVIAVDATERIVMANDASRSLLEFVTAEEIGRPLLEVTRCRAVHEAVMLVLHRQDSCQSEFELPGTPRRVLTLRATRFPGEPCPGVVVVLRDVTELRRLENLRREFVANVSHELKTPLASIKAYSETLRLGAIHDSENNVQFVERIEEQAERLNQLIMDLIQIARVESGQAHFEITDVATGVVVDRVLRDYADQAEAADIKLLTEPPAEPVAVRADEEGLRTIIGNLVDNALKYTPDGGAVTIRWRKLDAWGEIEVEDTGIGIPKEQQPRIFERFFRVDKARSRELGGTGLGLSIVKHLSQAFGGNVSLVSEPGVGSRFTVRLPLGEEYPRLATAG